MDRSNPRAPHHCTVCGSGDVVIDSVDALRDGAELLLGECSRCEHRWTRTVLAVSHRAPARSALPETARPGAIPEAA